MARPTPEEFMHLARACRSTIDDPTARAGAVFVARLTLYLVDERKVLRAYYDANEAPDDGTAWKVCDAARERVEAFDREHGQ